MKKSFLLFVSWVVVFPVSAQQFIQVNDNGFAPRQRVTPPGSVLQPIAVGDVQSVYAADLDGDGDQDALLAATISFADAGDVFWAENDGKGNFINFDENNVITRTANGAQDAYAADLDGDGDLDVLSASADDAKTAWYENDGAGNFGRQQVIDNQTFKASSVYAADLDGDGDVDVISAAERVDRIAWYENDGTGTFSGRQVITAQADGVRDVYVADLDGDGDSDVLSASANDNTVAWYENDGTGGFDQPQIIAAQADGAQDVYVADLDGDGDPDVLSASANDNTVAWYENNGTGNFSTPRIINDEAIGTQAVYAADLDGDGDADVLATARGDSTVVGNEEIAWYENDGTGSFGTSQVIDNQLTYGQAIYATDLDGDNDADVLSGTGDPFWYENVIDLDVPFVAFFQLVNTTDNVDQVESDVRSEQFIQDSSLFSLPDNDLDEYTITANVYPAGQSITRVVFDLTAPAGQSATRTERIPAYSLFGNTDDDYQGRKVYAGDYELTATPFYRDETGTEVVGTSQTVNFSFITTGFTNFEPLIVRNIRLVDSESNRLIAMLEEGEVINVGADQAVAIVAEPSSPEENSVQFDLRGPLTNESLENFFPYSAFGDTKIQDGFSLMGKVLPPGEYSLSVIPFLGKRRNGYAGLETVINFTVAEEAAITARNSSLAYPVPFSNRLNVRLDEVDLATTRIELVHSYGSVYTVAPNQITATEGGVELDMTNLPAGSYVIRIQEGKQIKRWRVNKQ